MSAVLEREECRRSQSNLVLETGVGRVGGRGREREVVVEVSCSEVGRGLAEYEDRDGDELIIQLEGLDEWDTTHLGDDLRALHGLTIPESSSILS